MSAEPATSTPAEDTLIGHLLELRNRLLRSVIVAMIAFFVLIPVANELFDLLSQALLLFTPGR